MKKYKVTFESGFEIVIEAKNIDNCITELYNGEYAVNHVVSIVLA